MKKKVSYIISLLLIFCFISPVLAVDTVYLKLVNGKQEIKNRHIEGIELESVNLIDGYNPFKIIFDLLDKDNRVLNKMTTSEKLGPDGISEVKAYTKILKNAVGIRVYAIDSLDNEKIISNIIDMPIKDRLVQGEIVDLEELSEQAKMGQIFRLPKQVKAKLSDGNIIFVDVIWDDGEIDTSKEGVFIHRGRLKGYRNQEVILKLNIINSEKIVEIKDISLRIDKGDSYSLPEKILGRLENGDLREVNITWDKELVNTNSVGRYEFEGSVDNYNEKVKLVLFIDEYNGEDIVDFENKELERVIGSQIGKKPGEIKKKDLFLIKELSLEWAIYEDDNLSDLRYLKNLEDLNISNLAVMFGSPPKLDGIENLINLKSLKIFSNNIVDITSLYRLVNLEDLNIASNMIEDISPLVNMKKMKKLNISENKVSDIKLLENMLELESIGSTGNNIRDYSPLAESYKALKERDFELELLKMVNGRINYKLELDKTVYLPYKVLEDNKISTIIWEEEKIEGNLEGTFTLEGRKKDSEERVYFECEVGEDKKDRIVSFKDKALEKAVRSAVDKYKGDLYLSDVRNLKVLEGLGLGINNLEGIEVLRGLEKISFWANEIPSSQLVHLQGLKNLKSLDLAENKITYIPAGVFDNMTNLKELVLDGNQITNIPVDSFKNLKNLEDLLLDENRLREIEAVRNLTNLKTLFVRENKIKNIKSIENLLLLESFWAENNEIEDLKPMSKLENLKWVNLSRNKIEKIDGLSNSKDLYRLKLSYNCIKDLKILEDKTKLDWLELEGNFIEDISSLKDLTNLTILNLKNNQVTNIEALDNKIKLKQLYLLGNKIDDFSPIDDFINNIKVIDFK